MKKLIFLLFVLFISCAEDETKVAQNKIFNMDWIVGNWIRITEEKTSETTYEEWTKTSETEYKGHGYVVKDNITIWEENIKLFKSNSNWFFEVSDVNEDATKFKIIKFTNNSFVSKNKENAFPNIIKYALEKDTLKAIISGNDKEIPFNFIKN